MVFRKETTVSWVHTIRNFTQILTESRRLTLSYLFHDTSTMDLSGGCQCWDIVLMRTGDLQPHLFSSHSHISFSVQLLVSGVQIPYPVFDAVLVQG